MTRLGFRAALLLAAGLSLAPIVGAGAADQPAGGKVSLTIVNIEYEGTKVWIPATVIARQGHPSVRMRNSAARDLDTRVGEADR